MNVYNHIAEKSHVENEMPKMNLGRNLSFAKFHSYRCLCTARE